MRHSITRRSFLRVAGGAAAATLAPPRWAWPDAAPADGFARLDASAQAELVRTGEVSSIELVDAATGARTLYLLVHGWNEGKFAVLKHEPAP